MIAGPLSARERREAGDRSGAGETARVEPAPRRRHLRLTTVVASTLALVLLFGLVGFHAAIVANQSIIDGLDAQMDEAERANQRLRLEVAELEAPDRVRAIATTTLGMVEPERVEYLQPISSADLEGRG